MFQNYNNRRLINNMGYQQYTNYLMDAVYQHPMKSIHGIRIDGDKIDYIRSQIDGVQVGSGFDVSDAVSGAQAVYTAYQTLKQLSQNETVQSIESSVRNTLGKYQNASNENWRPSFPGERHLVTKTGVSFNYAGPGTHLKERLARGDPPLDGSSGIDAAAMEHDIAYHNAQTVADVRRADKKLITRIDNSTASGLNKQLVKGLVKAKMFGEDLGLIGVEEYTTLPNLGRTDTDADKINEMGGTGYIPSKMPILAPKHKQKKKNKDPAAKLRRMIR